MEQIWTPFVIAALMGGVGSVLAQAGSDTQSRLADLIAALVTGCFFGTFALFLGWRIFVVEAVFCIAWVAWAHLRTRRPRAPE
jgi:hypothetical protein